MFILTLCAWVFFIGCVCAPRACRVHGGQKRASEPVELGLQGYSRYSVAREQHVLSITELSILSRPLAVCSWRYWNQFDDCYGTNILKVIRQFTFRICFFFSKYLHQKKYTYTVYLIRLNCHQLPSLEFHLQLQWNWSDLDVTWPYASAWGVAAALFLLIILIELFHIAALTTPGPGDFFLLFDNGK